MPQLKKKTKEVKVWNDILGEYVSKEEMDDSLPPDKVQAVYDGMQRARQATPPPQIQPAWQTESPMGGTHASLPVTEPLGVAGVSNPGRPPGQAADAQSLMQLIGNKMFNPEILNTGVSENMPVFEGRGYSQPDVQNLGTSAVGAVGALTQAPFAQALMKLLGRNPAVASPNLAPVADGYAGASAPTRMTPMTQTATEPMYGTNVTFPRPPLAPAQSAHNLASNVAAESGIPSRLNTLAQQPVGPEAEAQLMKVLDAADVGKPGSAASYGPFNAKAGIINEFRTNPVFRAAAMRALRIGGGTAGTIGTTLYGLYKMLHK